MLFRSLFYEIIYPPNNDEKIKNYVHDYNILDTVYWINDDKLYSYDINHGEIIYNESDLKYLAKYGKFTNGSTIPFKLQNNFIYCGAFTSIKQYIEIIHVDKSQHKIKSLLTRFYNAYILTKNSDLYDEYVKLIKDKDYIEIYNHYLSTKLYTFYSYFNISFDVYFKIFIKRMIYIHKDFNLLNKLIENDLYDLFFENMSIEQIINPYDMDEMNDYVNIDDDFRMFETLCKNLYRFNDKHYKNIDSADIFSLIFKYQDSKISI